MTLNTKLSVNLERLMLAALFIGLFLPLTLKVFLVEINPWHIPFIALLITSFLRVFNSDHVKTIFTSWDIVSLFLVLSLFIGVLISANKEETFSKFFTFSMAVLLSVFIRKRPDLFSLKHILLFVAAMVFVQSVIGIIQQITGTTFGSAKGLFGQETRETLSSKYAEYSLSRVLGTLGHPNFVGSWVLVGIPYVYFFSKYVRSIFVKSILYVTMFLGVVVIVITFSRGIISLLVFLTFLFLLIPFLRKPRIDFNPSLKKVLMYTLVTFLITSFLTLIYDYIELLILVIESRFTETSDAANSYYSSSAFRLDMNKGAVVAFIENPLFGVGLGNMKSMWEQLGFPLLAYDPRNVHNIFFSMLAEGGLFSFIPFCFMIFRPLFLILSSASYGRQFAVIWSLLCYIFLGQIYVSPIGYENIAFTFLILGLAMGKSEKKSYQNNLNG